MRRDDGYRYNVHTTDAMSRHPVCICDAVAARHRDGDKGGGDGDKRHCDERGGDERGGDGGDESGGGATRTSSGGRTRGGRTGRWIIARRLPSHTMKGYYRPRYTCTYMLQLTGIGRGLLSGALALQRRLLDCGSAGCAAVLVVVHGGAVVFGRTRQLNTTEGSLLLRRRPALAAAAACWGLPLLPAAAVEWAASRQSAAVCCSRAAARFAHSRCIAGTAAQSFGACLLRSRCRPLSSRVHECVASDGLRAAFYAPASEKTIFDVLGYLARVFTAESGGAIKILARPSK